MVEKYRDASNDQFYLENGKMQKKWTMIVDMDGK